jgi:hypothetical protein
MKRTYISVGIFAALLMVSAPQSSSAYFTTAQNVQKINEHTALFAIEYAFGLPKQDIYMPILSERGLAWGSDKHSVGYTLRDGNGVVVTQGNAYGLAVSNAPIVGDMYKIEKGKAQKMTLYIILKTATTTPTSRYALQVDQLPYYMDSGKKTWDTLQLNPSELQYYVTKPVKLNVAPKVLK